MTDATPYRVPQEPGRWRAITLAVIVHAALFALLWFGVRWQNETPVAVEAEVWNLQPREAAPQPEPTPEIKPEPKPEPKPVIKETPKPQVIEPPVARPDPDIALEQEKKRKLQEHKKLQEQERQEERQEKQKQLAEQKAEAKRIAQAETETARKKAAADEANKIAADKKRKQLTEADTKIVEQRRKEDLARITNQAGSGGSGDAPKAQGGRADPGYTQRLSAKIKSNTTYIVPPDLENNPAVEYTVELLPDGSVRSIKKLRPSGLRGFDEAVERAIQRSEPYPADKSGTVPSSFTFSHKPKDNQ